jgi:hypothetical protein
MHGSILRRIWLHFTVLYLGVSFDLHSHNISDFQIFCLSINDRNTHLVLYGFYFQAKSVIFSKSMEIIILYMTRNEIKIKNIKLKYVSLFV